MRSLVLLAVLGLFLSGCGDSKESEERRTKANMQTLGQGFVKKMLMDADSAKFQGQFISSKGAPCGEVNAKNAFGAYTGFKRYIAAGEKLTIIEGGALNAVEFEKLWQQFCQR